MEKIVLPFCVHTGNISKETENYFLYLTVYPHFVELVTAVRTEFRIKQKETKNFAGQFKGGDSDRQFCVKARQEYLEFIQSPEAPRFKEAVEAVIAGCNLPDYWLDSIAYFIATGIFIEPILPKVSVNFDITLFSNQDEAVQQFRKAWNKVEPRLNPYPQPKVSYKSKGQNSGDVGMNIDFLVLIARELGYSNKDISDNICKLQEKFEDMPSLAANDITQIYKRAKARLILE